MKLAFVFPGQGSQHVGMGRDIYHHYPVVRELYEEASELLGYDLAALCFTGPAERLDLTEFTQPALLVTSLAAFRLVESLHLQPMAVAGHSLGEYSAIVAAGGLSFVQAVQLVHKRGAYMAEAVPAGSGLVAAVLGLPAEVVAEVCEQARSSGVVAPANFNCPGQIVIAGEKAAVEHALALLKQRGARRIVPLAVSVPVHTVLMQRAAERLAQDIQVAEWSDLKVPVINNVEARPLRAVHDVRASLVAQLASPVLWEQSVRMMAELGASVFIEVGPGKVLTGLVKRIVPKAVTLNVSDMASWEATRQALEPLLDEA
ncbi:MAG: [acyl-carrier-protein] S-malonyltransferase [Nitrospirae bacterium]|nr:MAG: [acyl-carrier-protein] S-malonyltransferase [Nitrospirota bacterium]